MVATAKEHALRWQELVQYHVIHITTYKTFLLKPHNLTKGDIAIKQVRPTDEKVRDLIEKLNQYQISLYGIEHCNLESPEMLEANQAIMLGAFQNDTLVGIGAIKIMGFYAEIKRMYVDENYRGQSIAADLLNRLENIAQTNSIYHIYLETGNQHHAAIRFYKKQGYSQVESFGYYRPNGVSIYFQKQLASS